MNSTGLVDEDVYVPYDTAMSAGTLRMVAIGLADLDIQVPTTHYFLEIFNWGVGSTLFVFNVTTLNA